MRKKNQICSEINTDWMIRKRDTDRDGEMQTIYANKTFQSHLLMKLIQLAFMSIYNYKRSSFLK